MSTTDRLGRAVFGPDCIVCDGFPVVSVRRNTVDGAGLVTATIVFDSHKSEGASADGGVDGDTAYPS
jgi:hypothetical protein